MRTTVTAILVAQTGDRLDETLEALAAQTRQPDRLIGVVNGSNEALAAQLAEAGADQVIVTGKRLSYGAAIAAADHAIAADGEQEWLWLLAEDTAPEPKALRSILRTVQKAPSVAVAGPKLLDWDHPERIIELGQSLTRYGNRWKLRRQKLDQQQYDHIQNTLGVGYEIFPGDRMDIELAQDKCIRTITMPERTFLDLVQEKLGWGQSRAVSEKE